MGNQSVERDTFEMIKHTVRPLAIEGMEDYWIAADGKLWSNKPGRKYWVRTVLNPFSSNYCLTNSSGKEIPYPTHHLVAISWYKEDPLLWNTSIYRSEIARYKEFFSIPEVDIAYTGFMTSAGVKYYVTRYGDVWSDRFYHKKKPSINAQGYLVVNLGRYHGVACVHTLVAKAFCEIPKDLLDQGHTFDTLCVNHKDGDKTNPKWTNLEWVTPAQNLKHAFAIGLNKPKLLTNEFLMAVGERLAAGRTNTDIANELGVDVHFISKIRKRDTVRTKSLPMTWRMSSIDQEAEDRINARIRALFDEGKLLKEIAEEVGLNKSTVRLRLFSYPPYWERRKRSEYRFKDRETYRLYCDGKTIDEIATIQNSSPYVIESVLRHAFGVEVHDEAA